MSLRQKLLLTFFLASALGTTIYTSYTYNLEKASTMRGIDRVLMAGAYALAHLFPGEFHASLTSPLALTEEAHQLNCRKLGILARQIGVKYLYSFLEYDGRVVFATSSAAPGSGTKIIDDPYYDPFFSIYGSASVDLKEIFRTRKPVFETVADRAGLFRSVLMPFEMPNGKVFVAGADIEIDFIEAQMRRVLIHYLLIGCCIFLATSVVGLQAISSLSRHLQKLTQSIQDLVKCEFAPKPEAQNELQHISETYRDEVGYLARAFLSMQRALQSYLQNLARTTAQKEKIQSELRIAHNIQMSMVPRHFPQPEDTGGIMLHAVLEPAREVGGDFYDFFPLNSENHVPSSADEAHRQPASDLLAFAIGDVSGKGMPAALFMAMVKTLFRATAGACHDPAQTLGKLNDEMARDNATSMFTTMQVGIINLRTRVVTIAGGGHNYPILISADGNVREMKLENALPIGVYENIIYKNQQFTLQEGETLVLFTDGITEAMNEKLEEFSDERFQRILSGKHEIGLEQLSNSVYQEIRRFAGTQDPSDDATLLLIRVFKPLPTKIMSGPTLSETAAFGLPASTDGVTPTADPVYRQIIEIKESSDLKHLQDLIDRQAPTWGLTQPDSHDLHLVLDELIENILRYGYAPGDSARITVELGVNADHISLCLRDTGKPFDPLGQARPDTTAPVESRTVGGWGIHLVKQYSDSITYERTQEQNVVRLSMKRRHPNSQEGTATPS